MPEPEELVPEPEEPDPDWAPAETGCPVVDWVVVGLEWLVLDWVVVGFEPPVTDWVAAVAWADEPVPGGLVGEPEVALPDGALPDGALAVEALVLVEPVPAVAEPELPASVCDAVFDAVLTAEPTAELAVDTGESADDGAEPEGGGGFVAACACRENTSMITKIPAATIASCTAR